MDRETLQKNLISLFQETAGCKFNKKHYTSDMEEAMGKYKEFLQEMVQVCAESEEMLESAASCVPEYAFSQLEQIRSKRKRDIVSFDYNLNMVAYFMPLIGRIESEKTEELIQRMTDAWNEKMPGGKIGYSCYESIRDGFRRSVFCYITTAVCKSLGRPDDCYELNTLRSYRDTYLLSTEEGRRMVDEYYNIAPTIVKRIDREENAGSIYQHIWETYINPCIKLIENGENEKCRELYSSMVRKLEAQYLYLQEDKA